MQLLTAFIMKERNDATIFYRGQVDLNCIQDYIHKKTHDEKLKTFGFMHVIIASYIKVLSQFPGLNRFISGQHLYHRYDIVLSMIVKKRFELNSQETVIKPVFKPTDTVYDVYRILSEEIESVKKEGDNNNIDKTARILFNLPAILLRFFVYLMRLLDYFAKMPRAIHNASPFHASLFISNLGSLGIQPVYHHLYNFGNVPIFITFGSVYKKREINEDGSTINKKFIDYIITIDERITDGHYYAMAIKQFNRLLQHPDELNILSEKIEDDIK